jgi:hypothetical protein
MPKSNTFCVYFGQVDGARDREFDWGTFDVAIVAVPTLDDAIRRRNYVQALADMTKRTSVLVYRHRGQLGAECHQLTLDDLLPVVDGLFLDYSDIESEELGRVRRRAGPDRLVLLNTGWSTVLSDAHVGACLLESFIGTHDEAAGGYPARYLARPLRDEVIKVRRLRFRNEDSPLFALTYGPGRDEPLARRCRALAEALGLSHFGYTQPPGWHHPDSDFRLVPPPEPTEGDRSRAREELEVELQALAACSCCAGDGACPHCRDRDAHAERRDGLVACPACRDSQRCPACRGAGLVEG